MKTYHISAAALLLLASLGGAEERNHKSYSGIYPHLAFYNREGECGTGAVVPWAGNLWVITYGPRMPNGSTDKLCQISPSLDMTVRKESIGGTPATYCPGRRNLTARENSAGMRRQA